MTTDRNGKLTTVYRKPDAAPQGRAIPSAPPAPAPAPPQGGEGRFGPLAHASRDPKLVDEFHDLWVAANRGRALGRDKTIFAVRAKEGTLRFLIDALSNKPGFGPILNGLVEKCTPGQVGTLAAVYHPGIFDYATSEYAKTPARIGYLHAREAGDLYDGLRRSRDRLGLTADEVKDLSTASPEAQQAAKDFGHLFNAVRTVNEREDVPHDLVTVGMEGPGLLAVAEAVRTTGSLDTQTIRGVLNDAPAAVADGWL